MITNETSTTELAVNSSYGTDSYNPSQHPSFKLNEEERLLIIFGCGAIIMVVIIATSCFVTECCWLFPGIKCKKKHTGPQTPLMNFSLPPSYTSGIPVQKYHSEFYLDQLQKLPKESGHSTLSLNSHLDPYSIPAEYRDMDDTNYGQITFSVRFVSKEKERTGQLCFLLKEAQDLPAKPYGGACDPYVVIKLYLLRHRHQKIKQNSVPFCIFQSSTKRKTRHPLYMENFVVSAAKTDLKICVAKLFVYDSDKYANDTELGECTIYLKDYHLWKNAQTEQQTIDLMEPVEDNGKLCLGLTFLPTAERVTFTIVQADRLKLTPSNPAHFEILWLNLLLKEKEVYNNRFQPDWWNRFWQQLLPKSIPPITPFVRVLMLCRGRIVQKRKTSVCRGSSFPVFNEVLVFDLPPSELENVLFVVVVSENGSGSNGSMEDPSLSPCQKKNHIGKIVLGRCAKGRALEHWSTMKQSPRKLLTYWHTLW